MLLTVSCVFFVVIMLLTVSCVFFGCPELRHIQGKGVATVHVTITDSITSQSQEMLTAAPSTKT